ncbi:unnamed protein product [Schistosoma bovis]|nr:unnamed protein product [Schistosoma bovis]
MISPEKTKNLGSLQYSWVFYSQDLSTIRNVQQEICFLELSCAGECSNMLQPSKHVRVQWWPTLENPWVEDSLTDDDLLKRKPVDYEISQAEYVWVEKILKNTKIPFPKNIVAPTPSGWIPPIPELSKDVPYSVRRSKNHMLPVYYTEKQRKKKEHTHGTRQLTVIRHVDGDMQALADDLRTLLQPKCEAGLFLCQVDEVTRCIKIEGLFQEEVAKFLLSKGF